MITEKQWVTINEAFAVEKNINLSMALRDLFALGCLFHAQGKKRQGVKAILTAWKATTLSNSKYDALFRKVVKELPGNENNFLNSIHPHSEFIGLIK